MQMNDEIKKELESISPKLADLPRQEAFNVPDNYFAQLPNAIQQRINAEQKNPHRITGHLFGSSAFKWAAASIVILILGSGYYYLAWKSFYYSNNMSSEAYIIENFDEGTISEYLSSIPPKTKKDIEARDNLLNNIDEELIIDEL